MDKQGLVQETLADGQVYEYFPLGKHIVSAPARLPRPAHVQVHADRGRGRLELAVRRPFR